MVTLRYNITITFPRDLGTRESKTWVGDFKDRDTSFIHLDDDHLLSLGSMIVYKDTKPLDYISIELKFMH